MVRRRLGLPELRHKFPEAQGKHLSLQSGIFPLPDGDTPAEGAKQILEGFGV